MSEEIPTPHTPGPWYTFANNHCVGGPHEATKTAGIAMCSMARRTPGENEANATLISAAPDLLAACLAILGDPEVNMLAASALQQARAAVAKARTLTQGE